MSAGEQRGRVRVLVVDDHDLFRTGLVSFLRGQMDIEVVGQASGGRTGVRLAHELKPDVVLMDVRMPDVGGIAATRAIVEDHPGARVVVLTVASEDADIAAAIEAGACGYLAKDTPIDGVVSAVRAAAQGATWLSGRAAEVILGSVRQQASGPPHDHGHDVELTPREVEVLRLVARGLDNAEIAQALNISPRTAKNHVSHILAKLGLSSRVLAATHAVRTGLA